MLNLSFAVSAQEPAKPAEKDSLWPIESITIRPLFSASYACSEHWEGQLKYPGDSLGADCIIFGGLSDDEGSGFSKHFKTDGSTNADWYGWGETASLRWIRWWNE